MALGNEIKKARKASGKTQQEIADVLNVTTQAVSQWENGKTLPTGGKLFQLAKLLDLKVQDAVNVQSVLQNTYDTTHLVIAPLVKWNDYEDWAQYNLDLFSEENTKGIWPEENFAVNWKPKGEIYALRLSNWGDDKSAGSNGGVIILDTGRSAERGDYVIVKADKDYQVKFGVYMPMGFTKHRAPKFDVQTMSGPRELISIDDDNPGFIVGVVREHRRFFRVD